MSFFFLFFFSAYLGEDGQLGHGDRTSLTKPRLVEALSEKHITQISCKGSHVLALTENGKVRFCTFKKKKKHNI